MHTIPLTPRDLALASGLILLSGLLSLLLRLNLERRLLWASLRMGVQLWLLGEVLGWVFARRSPLPVLAILVGMTLVAGWHAVRRSGWTYRGAGTRASFVLIVSGLGITLFATQTIIGIDPWYSPRYLIPLAGMVLGNSLTGISLSLDSFLETLAERREQVESDLALGATAWEAAREPMAEAVRRGMIPTINSMMVMGVVSLPGMMTGQMLGGEAPTGAVRYQILIMCMIGASVATGCILLCLLSYRRLFNARHQLRHDLLHKRA